MGKFRIRLPTVHRRPGLPGAFHFRKQILKRVINRLSEIQRIAVKIEFFDADLRFAISLPRKVGIQIPLAVTQKFGIVIRNWQALVSAKDYRRAEGVIQWGCECTARLIPGGKALSFGNS